MKPYIGLVHKEENSSYGITFPDAPGCFSAADELDQVFVKAEEALKAWIDEWSADGLPLPQTRDLSVIKADPQWAREFVDVALVIAVGPPSSPMRSAA